MDRVSTRGMDDFSREAPLPDLRDPVPDDRRDAPGAVSEHQLQVLGAVAAGA